MSEPLTTTLFNTLSAGRIPGKEDFNASKMFSLLEDPFGIWCQYHVPQEEAVSELNRYENLKVRTDRNTRDIWIKEQYPEVEFIRADNDTDRFKGTLEAMVAGKSAIANAAVWNLPENVYGSVNLLVRTEGEKSVFGDYYYKIIQFKRAHDLKEHYALQVSLLTRILGRVQNFTPYQTRVMLKEKVAEVDYQEYEQRLAQELAYWRSIRDGVNKPEAHKPPKAASSPWRVYANKVVAETKDLLMLPGLSTEMRQILKINGMHNTDDVAAAGLEKLKTLLEDPHGEETYYNSVAYQHHKPVLRAEGHFPPPEKKRNLYFDFEATETFTKENVSYVYLIGIWDKEENKYVSFIAKKPEEELGIFEQFFDYIKEPQDTVLYHWTEYEAKKMRSLAGKNPLVAPKLNALCALCFDLKIAVNNAFYLPSPSFSLKAAAPAFGFNWRQDDCGAMDSMVYFTNWLKTGNDSLMEKVLMYNEDDCKAMLFLEDYLKQAEILRLK